MNNKQELRKKFFDECTVKDSVDGTKIRIDYAPHDLFEWFWRASLQKEVSTPDEKLTYPIVRAGQDKPRQIGWETPTGALMSDHDYQFLSDNQKAQCKPYYPPMPDLSKLFPSLESSQKDKPAMSSGEGLEERKKRVAELYEANRPKFHDWGTLKDMCIATAIQYADEYATLRQPVGTVNDAVSEAIEELRCAKALYEGIAIKYADDPNMVSVCRDRAFATNRVIQKLSEPIQFMLEREGEAVRFAEWIRREKFVAVADMKWQKQMTPGAWPETFTTKQLYQTFLSQSTGTDNNLK